MTKSIGSDVALIIVNWNSGDILRKCLRSVVHQTVQPKRVIIIDNQSADDSFDLAKSAFSDFEYYRLQENLGFAAANNYAVQKADDCEWIALLNPDAFPKDDWLENLLIAANAHPHFSSFASLIRRYNNEDIIDGTGDTYHTSGLAWRLSHGRKIQEIDLHFREVFSPCAAAALFRRKKIIKAGLFDENFFCYFEDVDLGFRMQLLGENCLFVPTAEVLHIGSALSSKINDFALYHGHRNLEWSFFKNMPWQLLILYFPFHLLMSICAIIYFTLTGRGKTIFKAKWDALKGMRQALKSRKNIQSRRNVTILKLRWAMSRGIINLFRRQR